MKLLMISTDRNMFDPQSAVALRQIEYAKKYEEVHIVVFTQKSHSEISLSNNCWVYPTQSKTKWFYSFDATRLGRFIITRRGITHITCQDPFLTSMAGVSLKKQFNLPLEIQIHTDIGSPYFAKSFGNRVRKAMALSYIKKADHVRVVSKKIKEFLIGKLNIEESKIEVRPIYVDVEEVKAAQTIIDLHEEYSQFEKVILMASRLEKEKNIELALEAFADVVKIAPKTGLIIVGDGKAGVKLKRQSIRLGLADSVIFKSWADKKILYSYYKTADLFLLTSLYEGYGMTLVEAHAAGCPIISTDVGVAREEGATIVRYDKREVADAIIAQLS